MTATGRNATVCAAFCVVACAAFPALSADAERLILPPLHLKKNAEFIEKVEVHAHCGHIEAVTGIPSGWSISVATMNAGDQRLVAEAEHGASRLTRLGPLGRGIRIVANGEGCLRVTAVVTVSGESERIIELPQERLRLAR